MNLGLERLAPCHENMRCIDWPFGCSKMVKHEALPSDLAGDIVRHLIPPDAHAGFNDSFLARLVWE